MIALDTLRHLLMLGGRAVVALERQADALERIAGQPIVRSNPRPLRDAPPTADTPGDEVRG